MNINFRVLNIVSSIDSSSKQTGFLFLKTKIRYKSHRKRFCSKQTECSCHTVQECYRNGNQETGREKKV